MGILDSIYVGIAILAIAAILIVAFIKWLDEMNGYEKLVIAIIAVALIAYSIVTFVSIYWKPLLVIAIFASLIICAGYYLSRKYA